MLDWLSKDPRGFLLFMLYRAPAVLIAITLHEYAHGYVAAKCGDPTARIMGRLSLNPVKHMDPLGTICLFLFGFGWAKPVPINPNNFRNPKRDDILVSVAGVTINFIVFLISTLLAVFIGRHLYEIPFDSANIYRFFLDARSDGFTIQLFPQYVDVLMPLLKTPWLIHLQRVVLHSILINIGLCLFNLLPLPPLDGFHLVNQLIFKGKIYMGGKPFRIMQAALMALMLFTDVVSDFVGKAIYFVQGNVLDIMLRLVGI